MNCDLQAANVVTVASGLIWRGKGYEMAPNPVGELLIRKEKKVGDEAKKNGEN